MGVARLVLAGLAVLALVALIVVGALSLIGALDPPPESAALPAPATSSPPAAAPTTTAPKPSASGRVPTVLIQCARERCPAVFLKVVGGDVLLNRELVKDEQVQSFDSKVDVVLADSTAVHVRVNGTVRPPGKPGERQEFTVSREQ
ncbi:hypothetical protein [Streptosporangium lutulentum]|uniref:DUF4115 domain-containing protein n=1 Tax=Streptosporangium lutulentum TaxID=1461250 RepID=A0ABT9QNA5_9ACTN|nr:hypothetical protein [Streptosporangium lutulentum]MDP9847504.1 hypothetical protein [Streptosporangium lutulentum]